MAKRTKCSDKITVLCLLCSLCVQSFWSVPITAAADCPPVFTDQNVLFPDVQAGTLIQERLCQLGKFRVAFYKRIDNVLNKEYRTTYFDQNTCKSSSKIQTTADQTQFLQRLYGIPNANSAIINSAYEFDTAIQKALESPEIISFATYQNVMSASSDLFSEVLWVPFLSSRAAVTSKQSITNLERIWREKIETEQEAANRSLSIALDFAENEKYAAITIEGICEMWKAFYNLKETMVYLRSSLAAFFMKTVNQSVE